MTARLHSGIAAILFTAAQLIDPRAARAQERPATSAEERAAPSVEHDAWQPELSVVAGLTQWTLFRGGLRRRRGRLSLHARICDTRDAAHSCCRKDSSMVFGGAPAEIVT